MQQAAANGILALFPPFQLDTQKSSHIMASAVCTMDASVTFPNRVARSLPFVSHQPSPLKSPPAPSTPTNPLANITPSGSATSVPYSLPPTTLISASSSPLSASSPSLFQVPMNTPHSNVDSGISSPSETKSAIKQIPVVLEAHHSPSPLLTPSVPPNSPECFPFNMGATEKTTDVLEDMSASLGEQLTVLSVAASRKDELMNEEVKVLKSAVPKAPGT